MPWRWAMKASGAAPASIRTRRTAASRPSRRSSPWRRCRRWSRSARPGSTTTGSATGGSPRWHGSGIASGSTSGRRGSAVGPSSSTRAAPLSTHSASSGRNAARTRAAYSTASRKPRRSPARRSISGSHISFSGILTFKNAAELREVASFVPLDRCLIETDSPYLAPMPLRGKINTPANVPLVAAKLAEIKGLAIERIAEVTATNFERLFLGSVSRTSSTS